MKECFRCKLSKTLSEFSIVGTGKRAGKVHSYCKTCVVDEALVRQRAFKLRCVEYKGSVCIDCDVKGHPAIYDFHHLDPEQKDFNIAKVKSYKWSDEVKSELAKCVLLCSNCHRLRHAKY